MKAVIGQLPSGNQWAFELKWDGMRLQATCGAPDDPSSLVLRSISGREVTSSYPELTPMAENLGTSAVLDGEAVVFDGDRPSFGRLQHRMHVSAPSPVIVAEHPVVYIVFDLLELDGRSLLELPYRDRRRLLAQLVEPGPAWQVPPLIEGNGAQLLALAEQRGLEGVVAKLADGPYRPGTRSNDWIKIKIRKRQEFVVVGWLPGQGNLTGSMGSLLLAVWQHDRLVFTGAVGSGLTERDRTLLADLLGPPQTCPFDPVPPLDKPPTWVAPDVVVEVEYGSWPADGVLRHPVYRGLRPDKRTNEVERELPP